MKCRVLFVFIILLVLLCACRPEPYVEVDGNLYKSLELMLEIKEFNMRLEGFEYYDDELYIHYINMDVGSGISDLIILEYTKKWLELYSDILYSYYLNNDLCSEGETIKIELVIGNRETSTTLDNKHYIGYYTNTMVSEEWEYFVSNNRKDKEVIKLEE